MTTAEAKALLGWSPEAVLRRVRDALERGLEDEALAIIRAAMAEDSCETPLTTHPKRP